ncbi:capsular biosynthesis protein [Acinetobacter rudis]|uniref:capsular biosynthesis protein n=1 Tax=Acinetobacter rudis TaxID=632955 RepID=UPI002810B11A|nr:capsular biosynthesis protein [Acinetobacter rudis]
MIVIPMAGLSSRFFNAGYTLPKYMLALDHQTVFEWSVSSFKQYFETDLFIFVVSDKFDTDVFVKTRAEKLGIKNFQIVKLNHDTKGQAHTVFLGLENALEDELFIFNIDSKLNNFVKMTNYLECDGYLEVFKGEGVHWSFVEEGINYTVKKTTEKNRISDLCSDGLYYFKSSELFKEIVANKLLEYSNEELYIAPLYNDYISRNKHIKFNLVDISDIDFCGTPQEYIETLEKISGSKI